MNQHSDFASFHQTTEGRRAEAAAVRGRPSGYSEEAVERLRAVIREFGVSDCAAMERLDLGVSSLTRWKREHPELKARLGQAREEFREAQLKKVLKAAGAEEGRGWRAAAWLLERIFPADYARSAADRCAFERAETRRAEREERADENARVEERLAAARAGACAEKGESGRQGEGEMESDADAEWEEDEEDEIEDEDFEDEVDEVDKDEEGLDEVEEEEAARLRREVEEAERQVAAMSPEERAAFDAWCAQQDASMARLNDVAASEGDCRNYRNSAAGSRPA